MRNYVHPINKAIRQKRREEAFERWKWHVAGALVVVGLIIGF